MGLPSVAKPGNRESRERGVAHAGESDCAGQILAVARAGVDELAAQIREAEVVHQVRTKYVRVGAENALHADVGDIGLGVGRRIAVGAGLVGAAVVDVVAGGHLIGRVDLVVQPGHEDVAIEGFR